MVLATSLIDLGFKGNPFTWANNRHDQAYVVARLDMAFSNSAWRNIFLDPVIKHLPRICSNHSPLLLSHRTPLLAKNLPFKLESMWLYHVSFAKVVENSWAVTCCENPQFVMAQKLKILKQHLKIWNRDTFGQLKARIAEADNSVLACQYDHVAYPSEANHQELNIAKAALHNWLQAEFVLWKQRSKIS